MSHAPKARRRDAAPIVASDLRAPADERRDALLTAAQAAAPAAAAHVPDARQLLAAMNTVAKAAGVDHDTTPVNRKAIARASINLADTERLPVTLQRPVGLDFGQLRTIVRQDPVLQAIIQTRINQVRRFLRPSSEEWLPGFRFRFRVPNRDVSDADADRFAWLSNYLLNTGAEFDPRRRRALKRDTLSEFISKHLLDSLTMDAAPIELIPTPAGRVHGFVAVDAARVYLTDPDDGLIGHVEPPENHMDLGLHIPDPQEVIAVLTKLGRIEAWYTHDDLLYPIRRPSTDRLRFGYGQPEPEDLIKIVTGFLNALILNLRGFTHNSIPKGILTLFGDFEQADLEDFRSEWDSYVRGLSNRWSVPVLVSKDAQQAGANWISTGADFNEMYFAKWMTFLVAIKAGLYGMDPEEIAFESFTTHASNLAGSDTEERLVSSKDKGLVPLLDHLAGVLNDIVWCVDPDVELYWTGLLPEQQQRMEQFEKALLFGEYRTRQGLPNTGNDVLDNAPMSPEHIGVYQSDLQMQQQAEMQQQQMMQQAGQPGQPDPNQDPDAMGQWADADENGNRQFADGDGGDNWGVDDGSRDDPTAQPRMAKAAGEQAPLFVDLETWP